MLCSLCFSERLGRHSVWSPCDSWLKYRIDSALMLQWNSVVSRWSFSVSAMKVSSILLTRHPSHSKSCLSAGFSCLSGDLGTRQHDFSDPPVAVKKRAYGVDKYFSEGTSYWKTWWHPMTPCRKLNLHTRAFFFFFSCSLRSQRRDPATQCMGSTVIITSPRLDMKQKQICISCTDLSLNAHLSEH